ncbi:hypothetical protein L249_7879 [Ophiocordyceps polyrhachis-furcata BCC 54312]|uniref:Uncharacterized protein n=1 Tax=Ophiocordyceps polyrhachis-furcata BCC 54312 TaxID=1330021 RepID=A0A367L0M9_9HYPO|nr:hypothetical protein L249_7879 [Ophiocordyceps polyrhachis-furcata BCC 54312]
MASSVASVSYHCTVLNRMIDASQVVIECGTRLFLGISPNLDGSNLLLACNFHTMPTVTTPRVSYRAQPLQDPDCVSRASTTATSCPPNNILALLKRTALAAGDVTVTAANHALSEGPSPDTYAVKCLTDVDDDTHDFTVVFVLERLADGTHHDLKPETIDIDGALFLVLVGPLASMLVLGILPLGSHARLEKVIVGLLRQLGDGRDVVLYMGIVDKSTCWSELEMGVAMVAIIVEPLASA